MIRFSLIVLAAATTLPVALGQSQSDSQYLKGFYWGLSVVDCPSNQNVSDVLEGAENLPVKNGAFVLAVDPYGCAAKAGITPFTVISAINGEKIASAADFHEVTGKVKSGDKLSMRAYLPYQRGRIVKWKPRTLRGTAKSRLESVKGHVTATKDEVTGVTIYRHNDASGVINDKSQLELSIVHDGERYTPQLTIKYVADDWLFVREARLMFGKDLVEIPLNGEFNRDNDSQIWEWTHLKPNSLDESDELMGVIKLLADHLGGKVILSGQQYRKDRDLEAEELGRIREMWTYYRGLREREIVPGE